MQTYNLESCPIFSSLTQEELELVAEYACPLDFPAAKPLFDVGDDSDAFYLILRGDVKISVPRTEVEPAKNLTLRDGGFFGEIGLLRDCPRTASAFVNANTKLVSIPEKQFEELLERNGQVSRKIIMAILDRLNEYAPAVETPRRPAHAPQVVSVLSSGNHEGASFLAANLSAKLAAVCDAKVLAMDTYFEDPGLGRYLGALSNLGCYASIQNAEYVDEALLRDSVRSLDGGLDILGNTDAVLPDALRPRHIDEVIRAARHNYAYVVVDAGPGEDLLRAEVAKNSDAAIVVCAPTEASIEGAEARSRWLQENGLEGRVRFVLNKIDDEAELDPAAIEQVLGDQLLGTIRSASGEDNTPILSIRHAPDSDLALEISSICQRIRAGEVTDPPSLHPKVQSRLIWGFRD
jgi:CRP-like cAMP-binding protein